MPSPVDLAGVKRRARARRQQHRLQAGAGRIAGEQFAVTGAVHPIHAEAGIAAVVVAAAPAVRGVGHQPLRGIQRKRIAEQFPLLAIGIDAFRLGLTLRRHELHALIFIATECRVDHREFAGLRGVVAAEDGQHLARAGDAAGVGDGGGKPRAVGIKPGLATAVGVHLKQGLREHLAAVVVIPAGVDDPAVVQHLRIDGVHLVEAEPVQAFAVGIAGVQVARLRPPAIDGLHAAGRGENQVVVRQIGRFVIRHALAGGDLADPVA